MRTAHQTRATAYLHGFLSGPGSKKGRALAAAFEASGRHLEQLDLNRPSASELTITAALAELDVWTTKHIAGGRTTDPGADGATGGRTTDSGANGATGSCPSQGTDELERVDLIGSSLGGYLAALYAARHPEAVRRLVLLCPGIDMTRRWPVLFGAPAMTRWRAEGRLVLPNARGEPVPVHWGFLEDALDHVAIPHPACPTLIIHGTRDAVVPIESSRAWVTALPNARLIEVDDDHELIASLPLIADETLRFLSAP